MAVSWRCSCCATAVKTSLLSKKGVFAEALVLGALAAALLAGAVAGWRARRRLVF